MKTQMISPLLIGQRNDAIGKQRRDFFQNNEKPRLHETKIPPEDMTVGGVEDDGHTSKERRPPPQNPGL